MVKRPDGRAADALRPATLERGANPYAEGSCLIRMGGTLVLCTVTVEEGVPGWRRSLMYAAVRAFGGNYYQEREPHQEAPDAPA